MIYAIGHDIVENERIAHAFAKYGERFVNRVLSLEEKDILRGKVNKSGYIAKRFAAKEAFAKACGRGLVAPIIMTRISVLNDEHGKPEFHFSKEVNLWLQEHQISKCHLSLSDEQSMSSAFVVLEH